MAQALLPQLKDKIALITGASSGIGKATALEFIKHGASVALTGRNEANLEDTATQCRAIATENQKIFTIVADLSKEDDTKRVVDETIKHYNHLDILINNAGIVEVGSIETTTLEQYDHVMNINCRSIFFLTHLLIPHLIAAKGSIVNVSSVNGPRSFSGVLAYCMSKSAVDQFTNCIALELASKGVRVNSVNPGVIITNIHKRGGMDEEKYQQFLEHSKSTHALGRPGQPEEVAKAIRFLASEEASFMTANQTFIDGGRHAMTPR